MENSLGFVTLSALAVLGVMYLSSFILEIVFKRRYRGIYVVVPADAADESLFELMSFIQELGPIGEKLVVEMSPMGERAEKLIERGYCKAVLKPEELPNYISEHYKIR